MTVQIITAQWVLPVDAPPIENGYVAFENDRIIEVGCIDDLPPTLALPRKGGGDIELIGESEFKSFLTTTVDKSPPPLRGRARVGGKPKSGTILPPGLINCHIHLEQSFPQPIPIKLDEPFTEWLLKVVDTLKTNSTPEEKRNRCIQGVQEILSTGTTCVNDIASGPESLLVLDRYGLRGIVSLEGFHPASHPVHIEPWLVRFQELSAQYQRHTRLETGISPHSPYNVSPNAWQALLNAEPHTKIHSHVAETEAECQYLAGQPSSMQDFHRQVLGREFEPATPTLTLPPQGGEDYITNGIKEALKMSPIGYLHAFGLLNTRTILAHVIYSSAQDRALLKENGVTIAHCPRSNLALHGHTLDWQSWQAHDIPMGLGTDGRLSTPDLDLRAEAREVMALHDWTPVQALEALTLQGARAIRLDDKIGTLTVGKQADMVLWEIPEALISSTKEISQSVNDLKSPPPLRGRARVGGDPTALLFHQNTKASQVWIAGQLCGEYSTL